MSDEKVNGADAVSGLVKWFDEDKGYGFISLPGGGVDIFVHANQLRKSGINRALAEGEKVRFSTGKGPKGSFATDIKLISD